MTIFWILAAGLIGLALLFVITPLLSPQEPTEDVNQDELNLAVFRQQLDELNADLAAGMLDQTLYNAARRDLERELLYDVNAGGDAPAPEIKGGRWTATLLGIALPASAVALYLYLGNQDIIPRLEALAAGQQAAAPAGHPGAAGGDMPSLDLLVEGLAEKMEQNPENLDGWLMLGRSYFAINQPARALTALEKAYGLAPEQPDVLIAYAEAIAANNDSQLAGRPAELIQSALEVEPTHTSARWLSGMLAFQQKEFARAAEQWEALVADLDPASEDVTELRGYIQEARAAGSPAQEPSDQQPDQATPTEQEEAAAPATGATEATPAPTPAATDTGDTSAGASVTVEVSLAESLWPEADANATLFVYAKAVSGPAMPLAVKRASVADLPVSITLDDSLAMVPAMRLSAFPEVTVGARISKSGQATPQSGDLEGEVGPVKPGQSDPVKILIDQVRP